MSDFESSAGESASPLSESSSKSSATADLFESYRSLRNLVNVILIGLIVLSGSLGMLMIREIQIANRQVREHARHVTEYRQNLEPKINEFRTKLEAFSKLHPDFAPIYAKYFGQTNAPAAASAASDPLQATQPPR